MSGERLLRAAGIAPEGPLAEALKGRDAILAMTERSRASVLQPTDPGDLPLSLRAVLAARVALLTGEPALADDYRRADAAPEPRIAAIAEPDHRPDDARLRAIVDHVDLVASHPRDAGADDVAALGSAGVAEADIVRLSQLVAFVAYEARLVAGLRLMGGGG